MSDAYDRCLVGDVRAVLPTLPPGIVHCAVTSPPFWGLRDYGHADQIGMEAVPDCLGWATGGPCGACYVCTLVGVCREVRRVLRDDATLWLELGDSYATQPGKGSNVPQTKHPTNSYPNGAAHRSRALAGLKPKDLCGIPWRVALALQADGWWLRSDIVWARPNPMPESVTDRPTKAHSYIFLLAKSSRYFYDADTIREAHSIESQARVSRTHHTPGHKWENGPGDQTIANDLSHALHPAGRNARSVWTIATKPYSGAHFACWPPELVKRCILAGTSEAGCCEACGAPRERVVEREAMKVRPGPGRDAKAKANGNLTRTALGGTMEQPATSRTTGWRPTCACAAPSVPCLVLDPFMGSGTTAQVAQDLGRRWLGVELNEAYVGLQAERAAQTGLPLLAATTAPAEPGR